MTEEMTAEELQLLEKVAELVMTLLVKGYTEEQIADELVKYDVSRELANKFILNVEKSMTHSFRGLFYLAIARLEDKLYAGLFFVIIGAIISAFTFKTNNGGVGWYEFGLALVISGALFSAYGYWKRLKNR